jgi:hypothetical protein
VRDAEPIIWLNEVDFDPATLHDWPEYESEMQELPQHWAMVRA